MKQTEAQKALNDAYNRLRVDYGLSECLLGDFLHDRGQPGLMMAFMDITNTVAVTVDEVNELHTNQNIVEFLRLKLLVSLEQTQTLMGDNIKKLKGRDE